MADCAPSSRAWLTFAIAAVAGASVWALAPFFTSHREPWDAEGFFYFAALLIAGFVAGLLVQRPLWAHYLGAVVGQLVYEALFLPIGPLFVLGIGFLLGYSLLFLGAASLAALIRARLRAPSRRTTQ